MSFPSTRLRRLRASEALRAMVRETSLSAGSLVAPLFVCHGERVRRPIGSMPGHAQISVDVAVEQAKKLATLGVGGVILFGIPASKDPEGREAYDPDGIVPRAFRAIKAAEPDLLLWADVCLCEYTDHGHCGVVRDGVVDNDRTLPLLARALGWLHGQDRFFQIDLLRRVAAGELCELFGKRALIRDQAFRLHGFRKLAQTVVAHRRPEQDGG